MSIQLKLFPELVKTITFSDEHVIAHYYKICDFLEPYTINCCYIRKWDNKMNMYMYTFWTIDSSGTQLSSQIYRPYDSITVDSTGFLS